MIFFFDNFFFLDDFFLDNFFFLIIFFLIISSSFFWWFFFNENFFNTWLNSTKDTKLPMYPREGSSHHVVQKNFFYYNYFFFHVFFAKRGAQCVIVGITTNRTRDLGLKGDTGVQLLRHTRNWWHGVGLISPYWYAFKGNGKTSCTFAALQWVV